MLVDVVVLAVVVGVRSVAVYLEGIAALDMISAVRSSIVVGVIAEAAVIALETVVLPPGLGHTRYKHVLKSRRTTLSNTNMHRTCSKYHA